MLINLVLLGKKYLASYLYNKDCCKIKTIDYKFIKFKVIASEITSKEIEGDLFLNCF